MKRLLQVVSVVMVAIALVLVWKIAAVFQIAPPEFADPPQTTSIEPLPPPPRPGGPADASVDAIVAGDLFETDRGASAVDGEAEADDVPLPAPTNIVLNGIFFHASGRPMAIVTDTSSGNRQLTLQQGDSVGDYQVGTIDRERVTLLGRVGQQFSLELSIGMGSAPGVRPPTPQRPAPRPPAATPARAPAATTAAQQRAAAQARRVQAANRQRAAGQDEGAGAEQSDAVQSRLEALRRLREASARR